MPGVQIIPMADGIGDGFAQGCDTIFAHPLFQAFWSTMPIAGVRMFCWASRMSPKPPLDLS